MSAYDQKCLPPSRCSLATNLVKYDAGSFSDCLLFRMFLMVMSEVSLYLPYNSIFNKRIWQRRTNTGCFHKHSLLGWASADNSDLWDGICGYNTYQYWVTDLILWTFANDDKLITCPSLNKPVLNINEVWFCIAVSGWVAVIALFWVGWNPSCTYYLVR